MVPRWLLNKLRLRLSRTTRELGAWVEPRDPAYLTSRLERGETVWRAFIEAGTALRRCGRFLEADRMIERGLGAFPDDPALLFEYALAAHNSGRYALAIQRWERALRMEPDRAMCHCGLAANLRETGDLARAEHVIDAALTKFPEDLVVVSEAARIADARGMFGRSLPFWTRVAHAPDPPADWLQGEAHALINLGRFDEASTALATARARFPEARGLMALEAVLTSERGDAAGALALWAAYLERFPDDKLGQEHYNRAATQAQAPPMVRRPVPSAEFADGSLRALLGRFEGIGDTGEFGALQRRFRADAEGLLDRNRVTFDGLVSALGQGFAGMGEPAHSELVTEPDGEYVVQDRRWGLGRYTSAFAGKADGAAVFSETCRTVARLRGAFLADLETAGKILVFRSEGLDGDRLEILHRALRAFGPVRLLNVQPAAPTAPTVFEGRAGELLTIGEDLYVGFIERLGIRGTGDRWDTALSDWVSVCTKAVERG